MRPPSPVTTMPKSSGLSTAFSAIVTAASLSVWNRTRLVRSKSVSASPEMTSSGSSIRCAASRTEPAVPIGVASSE